MSALVERIAEVLREHVWYFVGNLGVPGMPDQRGYKCPCGWETHADGEHPADNPHAHVAERVAEALQLAEERHWVSNRRGVLHHAIVGWTAVE